MVIKIEEVKKIKWRKEEEWFERWYHTELCFIAYSKGKNPLRNLFTTNGLNSLALNTHWFYEVKGLDLWEKDRKRIFEKGSKIFTELVSSTEHYIKEVEKMIDQFKSSKKLDASNLAEIEKGLLYCWFIFLADLGKSLGNIVEERLKNKKISQKQIEEIKNYYFTIHKALAFHREEASLRKIYNLYKKRYKGKKINFHNLSSDIKKQLISHWEKFCFLTGFDLDSDPYSVEDFFNKLNSFLFNKPHKNKVILSINTKKLLNREDIDFLELINKHIYFDNYIADLCAELDFIMVSYLSKKYNLTFRDLTWYSFTELKLLVEKGVKVKKNELEERKKYRVMVQINGELGMFYGKENFQLVQKLIKDTSVFKKVNQIVGITASLGYAKGPVKIVKQMRDLRKVNKGDILVSITTRPDYMVAIQKCVAIVTDSGGITSHAAIISRELKIPCIVRTNIATQVLIDGDIVEVNATKGIITILT